MCHRCNMVGGVTLCTPGTWSTAEGRHVVFPRPRQCAVHKLSCLMNCCKMMNFQVTPLSKKILNPCMFLLLLCLGTILALTCPVSCQPSCSPSPSSGSVGAAWFHPFSRSTRPLRGPAPQPLLLHHQSRVAGQGGRRQPPNGLHVRPTKQVSFSDPLVSSPSLLAPPRDSPGTVFLPGEEVFARPGLAPPSQVPQTRYPSSQQAPPQRLDF
jgi:hypothetical protein